MEATSGIDQIKQAFHYSADVKIIKNTFNEQSIYFIFCDRMIDETFLNTEIVERMEILFLTNQEINEDTVKKGLHIPELKEIIKIDEAQSLVYKGFLVLYFEQINQMFAVNIAKKPNRNPEETKAEITIRGPRDGFIEDLAINLALIRKRLPTSSLAIEKMTLGKRSETSLAILYLHDVADLSILSQLKEALSKVDIDIILSGDLLLERVLNKSYIFPVMGYTGRPDFAMQALARGRFIVFIDGIAYANILPINLLLLLKSSEDAESPVFFSSFERILRIISILMGSLLPGFYLALTTFNTNQLPFQLLATIVQSNIGLPFPSALEMIVMLFLFELFREAGLRLPSVIGSTIGVVGGLIIGDAAIRAGITSPSMIVIIATSTIATYTLVNQSLVTAISIVRIFIIIFSSVLGLFGFFIAMFFVLVYLCNIRTFGVPYLNIGADLSWSNISKSIFRMPGRSYTDRPKMLNVRDKTRSKVEK